MHYNPSILHNHDHNNDVHNEIGQPAVDHILWHEEANEFIKRLPKQCYKNDTAQQQQQQQQRKYSHAFSRHSTGGNSGILYTHPSAIAMMTLNKRSSHGDIQVVDASAGREDASGSFGFIVPENNGLVGNELLTARQRHQRDLFSGDLGIPAIPPPPPPPSIPIPVPVSISVSGHTHRQRTHVGNVVHTFETLAMQRRLAAYKQHEQHNQQQKPQMKMKNSLQQNTFSKYLKTNNRFTKLKCKEQEQQTVQRPLAISATTATTTTTTTTRTTTISHNNNFRTKIKCNNTFNERNKQISQQYLHQMEIDYRKNLFSKQSHVTNNKCNNNMHKFNNNNKNIITTQYERNVGTISEDDGDGDGNGEAGVVAVFDEMLAGYSANECDDDDNHDDDDDYNNNHNDDGDGAYDDMLLQNSARVSIININSNEAQDNVLHINLSSTNGTAKAETSVPITKAHIKQFKCSNTNQRMLPIMRKKPAPPLPPPKPLTKIITTSTTKAMPITAKQHESYNNMLSQHHNNGTKCAVDKSIDESNEFLRGTTLSQSFVCQSNWQQKKKQKAPKPPILPITTPNVRNITKDNQFKTNTQLRIAITNPFRHVLRLNTKRSDSFNLLKRNEN